MSVNEEFFLSTGNGKKVRTKFEYGNIKKLTFYPENPRIGSFLVNIRGKVTDKEIEDLMWKKQPEATKTLYQQIKKDGQVNEPLVVYENHTLEGNTRLCVVRKLFEETKNDKWLNIPCRIILEKLSKSQIDSILCNYHIKKKKDWEPYEQACYFYKMKNNDGLTLEQIHQSTDVHIPMIIDYIKTFEKMIKNKAEPTEWSLYYETIKNAECKKAMKQEYPDLVEKVAKKYKEGKIERAEDVRKLKVILKDSQTARKFFNTNMDIDTAEKRALHRLPAESDSFLKDISMLTESINSLPIERAVDIKDDKKKIKIVKDFVSAVKNLCSQLKIKV